MITKINGVTLVELMVTLVVAGVVAAIAVPSFSNMIQENRLSSFSNDFVSSVSQARGEAIKNRNQVIIRPLNNDWSNGWQIVVDSNGNGSFIDDTDEQVRALELSDQLKLVGRPDDLVINANGAVDGFSWSGITVCDKRDEGRSVSISGAGIASVNKSPSC